MTRSQGSKPLGPLVVGLGGFVVLCALGFWQVQRLDWKEGLIAEAERRVAAPPVALPEDLDPVRDDYLPVQVRGTFDHAGEAYFLTSLRPFGPGFEVIVPFDTETGRRILVNRGFVPQERRDPANRGADAVNGPVEIEGVLRWPDDSNSFTPEPNLEIREWYARDVAAMAEIVASEPVMLQQAPRTSGAAGWPRPVATRITMRNDHLQYALTWFSLAAIWAVMSVLWLLRTRRS